MLPRTFEEMDDLRRSFDRMFESFFETMPRPAVWAGNEGSYLPAVETGRTDEHLNLRFILPAVEEKDLQLTVEGTQLLVRGERKEPKGFSKEGRGYTRLPYGKFERVVDLPGGLNLDELEARLHEGVLDIRIPVTEAVKPRKIAITAGPEAKKIAA